jgi:GNAT superfamily N-acetyltransferase
MAGIPNISIRKATAVDIPLILSFIKQLAAYEKLAHEVKATESSLKETLFGGRPYAEAIFAEKDGAPVGFALFFHNYSTFLAKPGIYLEDLFVCPDARGLGIGKLLLSYLAKVTIERGCGRLEWWVLNWNQSAIKFYESLGAVPMDEWTVQRVTGDALTKLANA